MNAGALGNAEYLFIAIAAERVAPDRVLYMVRIEPTDNNTKNKQTIYAELNC